MLPDETGPTAVNRAELGYFQRSWPISLILGSFFVLTVPLCVLSAGDPQFLVRPLDRAVLHLRPGDDRIS